MSAGAVQREIYNYMLRNQIRNGSFALIAAAAMACGSARAGIVLQTYGDLTSWSSAVTVDTTDTFDGLAPSGGYDAVGTTYTADGLTYNAIAGGSMDIVDSSYSSPYFNFGPGGALFSGSSTATVLPKIQVTLPANTTAVGLDLMTVSPNAQSVVVTLNDGESFTIGTANRPTETFFGFTASAPVSTITFTLTSVDLNQGTFIGLDNFSYGVATASDAPEASTLCLIGAGLIVLTTRRKKLL